MSLFRGINVVSLSVPNLDQARRFYGEVLGLGKPVFDLPEAGWIEFSFGGSGGNLALTLEEEDVTLSHCTAVVLNVDDCHAARTALRQRGVLCGEPVVFPGYVTYCDFYDPFGNRLQICSDASAES